MTGAKRSSFSRRATTALIGVTLMSSLLIAQPAVAYHTGDHLEVTPEVSTVPVGETATMTAVLVGNGRFPREASRETRIGFENLPGPDGRVRSSGLSCVIPIGSF